MNGWRGESGGKVEVKPLSDDGTAAVAAVAQREVRSSGGRFNESMRVVSRHVGRSTE